MSGVKSIKKQIIADANEKAKTIMESAKKEVKDIMEEAHNDAIVKHESIINKAKSEKKAQVERLHIAFGLEKRKSILKAKQDSINLAFEKAVEKVRSMDKKDYEEMILKLAKKALESNKSSNYEFSFCPHDQKRISKDFKETLASLTKVDVKVTFEEKKISTGFILKMDDIEINDSIESILGYMREKIEKDVYDALFS